MTQAADEINATKRKLIMRELATALYGNIVPNERVNAIALRHQLKPDPVRRLIASLGYTVEPLPPKPISDPKPKAPEALPVRAGIPPEVVNTILRGGIYKTLCNDPGADPSTVFVVTTLDKFTKEREAIAKLLKS